MSIASAMSTAVSGLKSEAQALSTVANNLANSSTIGYKANSTRFISLVTTSYTDNVAASGAGVTAVSRQNVAAQGSVSATSSSTDMAIDGNGFFVVSRKTSSAGTSTPTNPLYTRDGEFSVDDDGYLALGNDYYLEGYTYSYSTSTGANVATGSVGALRVQDGKDKWKPTANLTLDANLPMSVWSAANTSGTPSSISTTTTIYDTIGSSHTVTMTFTTDTAASDQWDVSLSTSEASLSFSPSSYQAVFDPSTGALSTIDGTAVTSPVTVSSTLTTATGTLPLTFDFTDLTQYDSGSTFKLTSLDQDGYPPSSYSGVTVSSDGVVTATYGSGLTITVGQVALYNFANVNGLTVLSDGMYQESTTSGKALAGVSGDNGTGTIKSEALEASTTDTGTEFTKMIVAQQAYSAASQVISTSKTMYDDLVSAVR
jgi:flagellar hook protein FlgE